MLRFVAAAKQVAVDGCSIDKRGTELTWPERLGIFGGTFDPVHLGHLIIAEELMYRLALDHVLFLPSRRPPHKTLQEISPNADRMTMLELAIAGNPHFGISTVDMHREGLSYTSDSLAIIREQYPHSEIYFLMGQDSLRDLPHWHEPNLIAERARLGVALRPGVEVDVEAILRAVPAARGRLQLIPVPLIQISSSEIRRRVYHGEPITYQVPRAVEDHIRKVGLYVAQSR